MAKAVVRKPKKKSNPLKTAKIEVVDYKDTALLRKPFGVYLLVMGVMTLLKKE